MTIRRRTKTEEADEIVRRLAAPPTRRLTATWTLDTEFDIFSEEDLQREQEIMEALSAAITKEIDDELLQELTKWQKSK